MSDFIEAFRAAMSECGLIYSGPINADKRLHRFSVDGENGGECWYKLHPDNLPSGAFGCWKRQINQKWHFKNGDKVDRDEYAKLKKQWEQDALEAKQNEAERRKRMAEKAAKEVQSMTPVVAHDYLAAKSVPPCGDLKQNTAGDLVLPLQDADGKIWSYQTIDFLGEKLFMPMGRVDGCFFQIGTEVTGPLVICEGYATGATIHQATGWTTVCAMNCGNLKAVAASLRAKDKKRLILIAADNDRFTKHPKTKEPWNPGLEKAVEAAEEVAGMVCFPEFQPDSTKGTDFNDLASADGISRVRSQIYKAVGFGMGQHISLRDLLFFTPSEDKNSVLGDRYLCKGGSCAIVAETSAGKSALGMQMAVCFALGLDFFGLKPCRPLKSIIVQAENDEGDTAEMFQGVLIGLGLVNPDDPEGQADIMRRLEQNLVIIRDQTHIGIEFSSYAEKLTQIHQPDLFWVDPVLSFYGDDINDQKAMSQFLRAQLNPISERTGIIWMLLHHTGKPSKDAKKSQKGWNSRDFNYMGIGSSELSNWARAIITVVSTGEDEFRVVFAKRGWRAKVKDDAGNPTSELHLAHSSGHICWKRIPKPKDVKDMDDVFAAFAKTITAPLRATEIVKRAAAKLQRGERTCWGFWDSGDGPLGIHFIKDGDGKWKAKGNQGATPYKDD